MAGQRLLQSIFLVALIGILFFATNAEARRRAPRPPKPRLIPILECVIIGRTTYTAYLGYENSEGVPVNVTVDTDDNRITGFAWGIGWSNRVPWHFNIWRIVPGRPGRSPLYPNAAFSLELPLYSIGIWTLCGRIVLITQWGPKCNAPDQTGPVFTTPSKCPATYTIPAQPGTVDGSFTQCFQAVDTDTEGGITWENTFDTQEDSRCLDTVPILGLGAHAGSVTARDRCGNPTKCDITVIVVDQEAPVVTCPPSFSTPITNIYDEKLTIGNVDAVKATARDNNPASPLTYKWYGRTVSWTGPQCLSGTGQYAAGQYAYGKTYLSWSVSDNAANTGTCSTTVVTVTDGAKPYFKTCPGPVTINQGAAVPHIYATARDTLTKVTVSVSRTSPTGVVTAGPTSTAACKNDVTVDGSQNAQGQTVAFDAGVSTLVFTATDENGNTETCTTTVTVITQNPQFTVCPTSQSVGTVFNKPYGNISVVAAEAPSDFTIISTIVGPSGSSTGGAQVSGFYPVGVTSITFTATKGAATISCKTITFTVSDTQAPSLACPSTPYNLNTDSGLAYATVPAALSATGTDNNKVTVSFTSSSISGGTDVFATATNLQLASATSSLPVSQLNVGTYGVTWSATDGVQSATPCTVSIVVTDNENPVIQCPASAVYTLAGGAESISVDASTTTVTATDNVGVVSITRNDGVVTSSVIATLVGPTFASGQSSQVYSYTFTAVDAQGNTASCGFSITINVQTYCTASTCANGGTCTTSLGNSGVAVGYTCDCSNTYCYSSFTNCKSSDTSTYPFPTAPATQTQTVGACNPVTVSVDSSTCMYAAVAAGAQNLVRSWTFVSATPAVASNVAAVTAILTAAGGSASVTFGADDLIGGTSYTIRSLYTHTPTGSTYAVDTILAKQSGNSPTVSISGPPYPWQLTQGDTTTQFTLSGSALTCGSMTVNPQYAWTSSVALSCSLVTNLATLTVPFSCSGLTMNADIVFTLTVTDGNGVTGSKDFTVKIVPYVPPSSECGQPNQAPILTIIVNRGPDIQQQVKFAQNGFTCSGSGGCAVPDALQGGDINTIDAVDAIDPRSCVDSPYPLNYHWEIFYPPSIQGGVKYTSQGISGYFAKTLTIQPGSLPDITTFSDSNWRAKVTLTSTVPDSPLTSVGIFTFQYVNSDLTLQLSTKCQSPLNSGNPLGCPINALAVDPSTPTAHGFVIQDASSTADYEYEWTSDPVVDLSAAGWNTSTLLVPTLNLLPSTYYVFTVTAKRGGSTGRKSITLFTASNTPSGGSFTVTPTTGTALSTAFLLSSTGWTSNQALTYAWKYIVGEDVVGATEISLTSLGWASSASVYLPAGRITLVAYIYAQEGSFVRKSVTIDVAEQTTTNRACWILDMMNTLLAQAEQQQDMSKTLQLVSYLADYLKDPSLQGVTSLTCNGVDRTADIQAVRSRFMTLLQNLSNQPLDATQASMLTTAMNKVISNARITAITQSEAVDTATMLSTVINSMSTSSGDTAGAMSNMQEQILSLVSQLSGWIQDCSILDTLAADMHTMFVAANAKGVAGSTNVYMSGTNVVYGSSTVWANVAQSASLDDVMFHFPAGALTSTTSDFNINFVNYLNDHVRNCRARDVQGNSAIVASTVVSVEVVNARDKSVLSVSGLATPITFTLPLRTSGVEDVPSCGNNAGPLTCAWWDTTSQGWSTAGCQTMSTSASTTSGAPGVQCACSHLTEFAIIRSNTICPDKSMLRGFRGTVAVYVVLFAIVFGLFCRTVRQTHFELRENMLFTFLASVACALRIAIGSHYAEFITFPTGVVDVLVVVPYAILYWINGHYFAIVRIQRIESTEARVRWRVEPIIRFVLFCVFIGMLALLAGTGMDHTSQSKMADVVSRIVALAYMVANVIFFGYGCTLLLGYATGRSDVGLTRALTVMSFATLMESIFWAVWPTNGYALFPATVCDLIALGVLIFRYRNPLDDKVYQSSRTGQRDASEPLDDQDDIRPELTSRLSHDTRSSQFAAMDSPRRPSTQLVEPPVMDGQA